MKQFIVKNINWAILFHLSVPFIRTTCEFLSSSIQGASENVSFLKIFRKKKNIPLPRFHINVTVLLDEILPDKRVGQISPVEYEQRLSILYYKDLLWEYSKYKGCSVKPA